MSRLHKAARATLVVQIFSVTGTVLSLIAVPLYLKWLGQERYGVLLTGLAIAGYLMFSDVGLSWSSMLLIAQANGRNDREGIAGIVRNSFSLAGCSALVVAIIVGLLVALLASAGRPAWLPQHPEAPGLLVAVGSSVLCTLVLSPFYNLFIGLQEAHLAALYQGAGRVAGTVASVTMAAIGAPLGFVFGAGVLCAFVAGIVAASHCARRHRWAFTRGSWWNRAQIRQQLRTGGNSFAMQIGGVLAGTAPVFAISAGAGPQFVPYLSIPLTLLNAPLGVLNSFSASLQPGYGEAIGRNESAWVTDTVRRILRQTLVAVGLLACGFILLAEQSVRLWTSGRINLPPAMLGSALAIAVIGAVFSVFRFALTGINRHRVAAASDLVYGALCMVLAAVAVCWLGYAWVGAGILCATVATSAWVLPRELQRAVNTSALWPQAGFWLRWSGAACAAAVAGWAVWRLTSSFPDWASILVTGAVICSIYAIAICRLLPQEWGNASLVLERLVPRSAHT